MSRFASTTDTLQVQNTSMHEMVYGDLRPTDDFSDDDEFLVAKAEFRLALAKFRVALKKAVARRIR